MIKVRATQLGYYGLKRRREGDIFFIKNEAQFSKKWMVKVDDKELEEQDDVFEDEDLADKPKSKPKSKSNASKKIEKSEPESVNYDSFDQNDDVI